MNRDSSAMSFQQYLDGKQVLFYLEDALKQRRDKCNSWDIARYLAHYFDSVCRGSHVLFREFDYIRATQHNRVSFIRLLWKCFTHMRKDRDLLSVMDCLSLLQLVCPDFPLEIVERTARIVLMDKTMDCLLSFTDFLLAFQIQFYYEDFVVNAALIYQDLLSGKSSKAVIVPTSDSGKRLCQMEPDEVTCDGVEAAILRDNIEVLCDRHKYHYPPVCAIREILQPGQRRTFHSFLGALAQHKGLSGHIVSQPNVSVHNIGYAGGGEPTAYQDRTQENISQQSLLLKWKPETESTESCNYNNKDCLRRHAASTQDS